MRSSCRSWRTTTRTHHPERADLLLSPRRACNVLGRLGPLQRRVAHFRRLALSRARRPDGSRARCREPVRAPGKKCARGTNPWSPTTVEPQLSRRQRLGRDRAGEAAAHNPVVRPALDVPGWCRPARSTPGSAGPAVASVDGEEAAGVACVHNGDLVETVSSDGDRAGIERTLARLAHKAELPTHLDAGRAGWIERLCPYRRAWIARRWRVERDPQFGLPVPDSVDLLGKERPRGDLPGTRARRRRGLGAPADAGRTRRRRRTGRRNRRGGHRSHYRSRRILTGAATCRRADGQECRSGQQSPAAHGLIVDCRPDEVDCRRATVFPACTGARRRTPCPEPDADADVTTRYEPVLADPSKMQVTGLSRSPGCPQRDSNPCYRLERPGACPVCTRFSGPDRRPAVL